MTLALCEPQIPLGVKRSPTHSLCFCVGISDPSDSGHSWLNPGKWCQPKLAEGLPVSLGTLIPHCQGSFLGAGACLLQGCRVPAGQWGDGYFS